MRVARDLEKAWSELIALSPALRLIRINGSSLAFFSPFLQCGSLGVCGSLRWSWRVEEDDGVVSGCVRSLWVSGEKKGGSVCLWVLCVK